MPAGICATTLVSVKLVTNRGILSSVTPGLPTPRPVPVTVIWFGMVVVVTMADRIVGFAARNSTAFANSSADATAIMVLKQ